MNAPNREPGDSALLLRYISGEASVRERMEVEQWLSADPVNREELEQLRRAWELAPRAMELDWNTQPLWNRIQSQVTERPPLRAARSSHPLTLIPQRPGRSWYTDPISIAAAVVLVVGAALLVAGRRPVTPPAPEVAYRAYTTKAGERAELRLADGTHVVVSGSSTLRIPENFGVSTRDVTLDGEAYFEVMHDAARPFRVHTQHTVAQDLGTKFVVTAYSADETERVVVAEGRVSMAHTSSPDSLMLGAKDVGRLTDAGKLTVLRNVNIDRYLSWLRGEIQFDEEPLGNAVKVLSRQLGIRVIITDSALARRRVSGPIRSATLQADLASLALLVDARYSRSGNDVVLTPAVQSQSLTRH